ncbi:MAG: hypothetical protein MUO54_02105 [Anaerolineales bacterium]|nr:hypothetical protein [Anaerolineales bacterium]
MAKKVFMWILFVAFVGILIFGAVNRTAAKSTDSSIQIVGTSNRVGEEQARGGSGNNNQTDISVEEVHESSLEEHEWETFTGRISAVDSMGIVILTESSGSLEISRRAWRFAQELGYSPIEGNTVILEGFFEDGEFETAKISDVENGEIIVLRDDDGYPLWAGGAQ